MNVEKEIAKFRKAHATEARRLKAAADKAFSTVQAKLIKKHGADVFTTFGKAQGNLSCFSTGFRHLDDLLTGEDNHGATVLGTGLGIPRGRILELAGREGAGKTTLSLILIAVCQRLGIPCFYIDAEHALDIGYARVLGVDMQRLLFFQPMTAEEGLDIADMLVSASAVGFGVVDSVAALVPQVEVEGDVGDHHMALQARLMSQSLRKLRSKVQTTKSTVLFINQMRAKIGGFSRFGPQEQTTGGNALRYFADIRLDMRTIRTLRKGTKVYGAMAKLKCIKNKVASPFREVFVELEFGRGIKIHPSDDSDSGGDE